MTPVLHLGVELRDQIAKQIARMPSGVSVQVIFIQASNPRQYQKVANNHLAGDPPSGITTAMARLITDLWLHLLRGGHTMQISSHPHPPRRPPILKTTRILIPPLILNPTLTPLPHLLFLRPRCCGMETSMSSTNIALSDSSGQSFGAPRRAG